MGWLVGATCTSVLGDEIEGRRVDQTESLTELRLEARVAVPLGTCRGHCTLLLLKIRQLGLASCCDESVPRRQLH